MQDGDGGSDSPIAIGDVQGCHDCLEALLERLDLAGMSGPIWLCGDLVNRGPRSLDVLRWARRHEDQVICVLGNHDLHLLAVSQGVRRQGRQDTLDPILTAPDRDELLDWLRRQPLVHHDQGWLMVHAGLLPQWRAGDAVRLAAEVSAALQGPGWVDFLDEVFGNEPAVWSESLVGIDRLRVIVNAMTRLRYCTLDGRMDLASKEGPLGSPSGYLPWFEVPGRASFDTRIVFGHWSVMGLVRQPGLLGLDTGCVWGGRLSAARLSDQRLVQVDCPQAARPGA